MGRAPVPPIERSVFGERGPTIGRGTILDLLSALLD
jgi:hypothetical protein